ncbi:MAG: hypothetical protein K2Q26_11625 [Bdellovibrionales bacterium]|nr:hypothetical protein [Bdellovibrionales bacterium]
MRILMFLLLLVISGMSHADYFELSASGNYRKSFLMDSNTEQRAYDEARAFTGAVSYYFREMTALEISYTTGTSERVIPSTSISSKTTHYYDLVGADLVFTFGTRTDTYIPYIKAGIGYFSKKRIDYEYRDQNTNTTTTASVNLESSVVPSAGAGIQIRLTERLAFKTGLEVWTSGPIRKKIEDFDWAARVGISWFL